MLDVFMLIFYEGIICYIICYECNINIIIVLYSDLLKKKKEKESLLLFSSKHIFFLLVCRKQGQKRPYIRRKNDLKQGQKVVHKNIR